jgi:hypothetical protein
MIGESDNSHGIHTVADEVGIILVEPNFPFQRAFLVSATEALAQDAFSPALSWGRRSRAHSGVEYSG